MISRETARWVVRARHCLISKVVARELGDIMLLNQWEARFKDAWDRLPIEVRYNYEQYLYEPAARQIEREGLLAQNGRYKL